MYKKGEKIIYPKHGAGQIDQIVDEIITGRKVKYYKISFFNSPISISIPVNRAEELGLRYPNKRREIKSKLKNLHSIIKINKKTLVSLDTVSKEKLGSGKMEDAIYLINLLKSLAKQKEEENKNFSYSYSDRLEIAQDFIKSEIELVLGKRALAKYEFD